MSGVAGALIGVVCFIAGAAAGGLIVLYCAKDLAVQGLAWQARGHTLADAQIALKVEAAVKSGLARK